MVEKKDESDLVLVCERCKTNYSKPLKFKQWAEETKGKCVFFGWSLRYCDECRRARERQALKRLPEVIRVLAGDQ